MSSSALALEIVEKIRTAGVRATTDAGALTPPAVLVVPPRRVYDVNCGWTAVWSVHAIAPAITGGDRNTWGQLDDLVDAVASVYDVETAQPGAYVLESKTLPSYIVTFSTPGG